LTRSWFCFMAVEAVQVPGEGGLSPVGTITAERYSSRQLTHYDPKVHLP
jgi:hypothetical protein